jgi:hypothetical protein
LATNNLLVYAASIAGLFDPGSDRGGVSSATLSVTATVVESCQAASRSLDTSAEVDAPAAPGGITVLCNDGVSWSSSAEVLQIVSSPDARETLSAERSHAEAQPERSGVSTRESPEGNYLRVTISY